MTSRNPTRALLALAATVLSMSALAAPAPGAEAEAEAGADAKPRQGGSWLLQRYDADGDGTITLQEFQSRGAATFAQLDADGDGRLSAEELAAAGRGGGRHGMSRGEAPSQQDAEQRQARMRDRGFARMDADGDGFVSRAEFDEARVSRFNALDANGNSTIDADEIPVRGSERSGYGKRERCRSK
jgi:Ca2+-binding EF-hand superfamily protein